MSIWASKHFLCLGSSDFLSRPSLAFLGQNLGRITSCIIVVIIQINPDFVGWLGFNINSYFGSNRSSGRGFNSRRTGRRKGAISIGRGIFWHSRKWSSLGLFLFNPIPVNKAPQVTFQTSFSWTKSLGLGKPTAKRTPIRRFRVENHFRILDQFFRGGREWQVFRVIQDSLI